jgi:hypothetical protein
VHRSSNIILLEESLSVRILTGGGKRLLPGVAAAIAVVMWTSPSLAQEAAGGVAEKA